MIVTSTAENDTFFVASKENLLTVYILISTKIFISIIEEETEHWAYLFRLLHPKFHLTELREVLCQ